MEEYSACVNCEKAHDERLPVVQVDPLCSKCRTIYESLKDAIYFTENHINRKRTCLDLEMHQNAVKNYKKRFKVIDNKLNKNKEKYESRRRRGTKK